MVDMVILLSYINFKRETLVMCAGHTVVVLCLLRSRVFQDIVYRFAKLFRSQFCHCLPRRQTAPPSSIPDELH